MLMGMGTLLGMWTGFVHKVLVSSLASLRSSHMGWVMG